MALEENLTPLLQAVGISKIYSQGAMAVGLHRFSASFYRGEFVAITGSSGSGKSTLLNLLSGLDNYDEGELYFKGETTSHFDEEDRAAYRNDNVAFIFQDYYLLDSYTVYQNIELALLYSIPDAKARAKRVNELIAAVGLEKHAKQRCSKLSGGQKQRVSIARALAKDAPILFADEPCGNLDSTMTAEVMELLHTLCQDKLVLIVTHSFDEVAPYATRKIRLADGECVEDQVFETVSLPAQDVERHTITRKQELNGLLHVAFNTIKATPKRTTFGIIGLSILTTIFIWSLLLCIKNTAPTPYSGYFYRYDLQVTNHDQDVDLTQADFDKIKSIAGVAGVYYYSTAFEIGVNYEYASGATYAKLRPVCNFDGAIYGKGRKPQANNEILISVPASRNNHYDAMLGKTISIEVYDYQAFENKVFDFVVCGVCVSDDNIAYINEDFFITHAGVPFTIDEARNTAIVTLSKSANMSLVRKQLSEEGYVVMHLYGDNYFNSFDIIKKWLLALLLLGVTSVCYRITSGSFRSLEKIKRRDYNVMRTVGLPSRFIQKIYYVEMIIQASISWLCGTTLSIIIWMLYGFTITPSITYGLRMMLSIGNSMWWIILLSLVVDLVVTLQTARRFNRYFYRQTVKRSLQGGSND